MHAANWLLTRSIFLKQFTFLLPKDKYYIGIVYRIYRMAEIYRIDNKKFTLFDRIAKYCC